MTPEERKQQQADRMEARRRAFRIFASPEGDLVFEHLGEQWFANVSPFTVLASGMADSYQTAFNLGKQSAYLDMVKWAAAAKVTPIPRQERAAGVLTEA